MSLTRQPALDTHQDDTSHETGGFDPLGVLGALGNQAMQSLLPGAQPGQAQPGSAAIPALSLGSLWQDNFGGGESPDLAHFGGVGGSADVPYQASSPLLDQLMNMDPTEALSRSGLPVEQWEGAMNLIRDRGAKTWGELTEKLGPEASKALMGSAANKLIDGSMDENGLTTLYLESLDPTIRRNPDTTGIQKALTDNMGDAVTKVFNPTIDEMKALFDTDRVRDAVMAMHGLPGHLQMRLGDSWNFKFQDPTALIQSMGESKNLRSVLLNACYGAAGGKDSIFRKLSSLSLNVLASEPILYGDAADKITRLAYDQIGQGVTPDKAFRKTASTFNSVANKDLKWQMPGAMSHWKVDQARAARGNLDGAETSANINKIFGDRKFFGINPIASFDGNRRDLAPIPMKRTTPPASAAATTGTSKADAPPAAADAHFGLDADTPSPGGAPKIPKFNLLEDGLNGLGMLGGMKDMWEGGGSLLGAFQGTTDARSGTIGGANLVSGAMDVAQNGLSLAEKVPQLAPWLAKSPMLKAFASNKAIGMLSALPSVAGYGYDMLTGAADHQKALSGGEAVQGLASAAASTFGGAWGMVASLGTAAGEGVFQNFVPHAEGDPTTLGQLGGMVDYSVDQVGVPQFMQDTIAAMAFDQRTTDPNADKASQDWAFASASMARLYLMADQGVHDLFGTGDQSMLHNILDPKAQAPASTPSAALTAGD